MSLLQENEVFYNLQLLEYFICAQWGNTVLISIYHYTGQRIKDTQTRTTMTL